MNSLQLPTQALNVIHGNRKWHSSIDCLCDSY